MKSWNVSPYSLQNYSRDAKKVIKDHLDWLRTDPVRRNSSLGAVLNELNQTGKITPLDPFYAAQWSSLARKRKAGLLLLCLYNVAEKHQLDMTIVFAQKLLKGWADCSISNKTLIKAFGDPDRDASSKSLNWSELEELINTYRDYVLNKLHRDKEKQKAIKDLLWAKLNVKPIG